MKNLLIAVLGATLLGTNALAAQDDHHPDVKKPAAESKARPPAAKAA